MRSLRFTGFLVVLIFGFILIGGCTSTTPIDTTSPSTSTAQLITQVNNAPVSGPAYSAGDIVKNTKSSVQVAWLIIGYDSSSDTYERALIYPNADGSWGYRVNMNTEKYSRTLMEKVYTEKITNKAPSSIPVVKPTFPPTTATGSKSTMTATATSISPTTTINVGSDTKPTRTPTPDTHQPIAAGTGPAAVLQGDDFMYLFVQGYDHALWYNREDLVTPGLPNWGWGGWISLGGQLTSSPSAVVLPSGQIDVFARGPDNLVHQISYSNGAWHNWVTIGGQQLASGTGPGVSGWSGHEDLFIVGTDGALWQNTWTASGWSSWASLGGSSLTSSPAAVSRVSGVIDVHVRGSDGTDNAISYSNGAWAAWQNLGGQIAAGTGPALGVWSFSPTGGTVYVFYTGTGGAMYQKTWNPTSGWSSSWTNLGGTIISSPSVAWSTQMYVLEVYARWTNDYLYLLEYYSEQWWNWMGGSMLGPPGTL